MRLACLFGFLLLAAGCSSTSDSVSCTPEGTWTVTDTITNTDGGACSLLPTTISGDLVVSRDAGGFHFVVPNKDGTSDEYGIVKQVGCSFFVIHDSVGKDGTPLNEARTFNFYDTAYGSITFTALGKCGADATTTLTKK